MLNKIDIKIIGGIFLIVGTSVGGAMLTLPIVNATVGFWQSSLTLFFVWALMTVGAFLILEVNLWFPPRSNLISMAHGTLGKVGEVAIWIMYLLLLYALLSAYISGGTDDVSHILASLHIKLPVWGCSLLFVSIFGYIVFRGIASVGHVNTALMTIKIISYLLLIAFISPHIELSKLTSSQSTQILGTLMVLATSFGYAIIIPSLRNYFEDDVNKLHKVILLGSLIPLALYLIWNIAIMGVLPRTGSHGLIAIRHSQQAITDLSSVLSNSLQNKWVNGLFEFFISISILTAFLGVSLSLSDFLADGMHRRKHGKGGHWVYISTFIPPLIVVLFYPGAFLYAFSYAGIMCVALLIFFPALMAYYGRYVKKIGKGYQVWGGKPLLLTIITISIGLLLLGLYESINL